MLIVGLTGGIASGKSTVAKLFAEKDIAVIDTDAIARALVLPEQPAYYSIIAHFGTDILNQDKTLNRRMLREIIFNNPTEKQWLEDLLHPLIRDEMLHKIGLVQSPYCVVVIPLLIEHYPYPHVNRILAIDIDEQEQIARAIPRDKMSEKLTREIIAQQASRLQRDKLADDIIYNNGSMEDLIKEVDKLHEKYLQLKH